MTTPLPPSSASPLRPGRGLLVWIGPLFCLLAGVCWLVAAPGKPEISIDDPQFTAALLSGVVARMDSPPFHYSDGWRLSPAGADPSEPGDPWNEPAGRVTFTYTGRVLALQLAVGNYWGYLFVSVDGRPANRLGQIPGNLNSQGREAGYKPLLAPERQMTEEAGEIWVPIHRADSDGPHTVEVEVWRGWGQTPLRAVAVDALPAPPLPRWPAAAFLLAGLWTLCFGIWDGTRMAGIGQIDADKEGKFLRIVSASIPSIRLMRVPFFSLHPWLIRCWPVALLAIGAGVFLENWLLTDAGLALLALAALSRPEVWVAALLFGLPFYLHPLPILPGRGLNLIEIGVWGGLVLLALHRVIIQRGDTQLQRRRGEEGNGQKAKVKVSVPPPAQYSIGNTQNRFLALLISFALLSVLAADYPALALREWRTVFLAGGGFALLLAGVFTFSDDPARSRRLLLGAWMAGGTAVALIALWQFVSGQMIIQAEGVTRVRGLYGSPNNLALYLERTLAVGIGYWGLGRSHSIRRRDQWLRNTQYAILLFPQLAALVLTFSKGALFLGIPAMWLVLGIGGAILLNRQGKSLRFLWWLVGIGGVAALGLLPFLGTDRFRLLLDFGAGTTGGLRLNLWRSAWQMALDHPWLGVGPDNFLYAYRSGYILPSAWQDPNLNHPHNFVLDWWSRLGLPALLVAGLWIGAGMRGLWKRLRTGSDVGLALGCLAAIVAALAHGLIDASFALPDLMLVWVLLLNFPTAPYLQFPRPEWRC